MTFANLEKDAGLAERDANNLEGLKFVRNELSIRDRTLHHHASADGNNGSQCYAPTEQSETTYIFLVAWSLVAWYCYSIRGRSSNWQNNGSDTGLYLRRTSRFLDSTSLPPQDTILEAIHPFDHLRSRIYRHVPLRHHCPGNPLRLIVPRRRCRILGAKLGLGTPRGIWCGSFSGKPVCRVVCRQVIKQAAAFADRAAGAGRCNGVVVSCTRGDTACGGTNTSRL